MKQRTCTEYLVVSTREGGIVTRKRYGSMKAVTDRIGRLTSDEPWRFYGSDADRQRDPDAYVCCAGTVYDECACGGDTVKEKAEAERAELPPVQSVVVKRRTVTRTTWEPIDVEVDVKQQQTGERE